MANRSSSLQNNCKGSSDHETTASSMNGLRPLLFIRALSFICPSERKSQVQLITEVDNVKHSPNNETKTGSQHEEIHK